MRRRAFVALMGASVTWPFAAMAQEPGRTYRLGCLFPPPRDSPPNMAFFDELRRRSFIEGQNLTVEYRAYGQHVDLIPQYATELVMARVDVIGTAGDETVRAVQQATKTIPIVALVGDMLGSGLVTSLARPDGNTTGVSILAREADGKRQDILIEAVPGLRLMAVLTDVNYTKAAKLGALQGAARAHNIEFSIHHVARTPLEELMSCSTFELAICCSRASFSSLVSRAICASWLAGDEVRLNKALGAWPLRFTALCGRALAGSPPALERLFIASTHMAGNEAS